MPASGSAETSRLLALTAFNIQTLGIGLRALIRLLLPEFGPDYPSPQVQDQELVIALNKYFFHGGHEVPRNVAEFVVRSLGERLANASAGEWPESTPEFLSDASTWVLCITEELDIAAEIPAGARRILEHFSTIDDFERWSLIRKLYNGRRMDVPDGGPTAAMRRSSASAARGTKRGRFDGCVIVSALLLEITGPC